MSSHWSSGERAQALPVRQGAETQGWGRRFTFVGEAGHDGPADAVRAPSDDGHAARQAAAHGGGAGGEAADGGDEHGSVQGGNRRGGVGEEVVCSVVCEFMLVLALFFLWWFPCFDADV